VAAPIIVEGRVWGAIGTGTRCECLPDDTEQRIADFTAHRDRDGERGGPRPARGKS
ncbi:MAG: hypothetical protein QOJ30_2675, partial [Pseudonocardiales bacterium]|nr:hypothetical protein [Pseudonocardiales bacterium]